MDLSNSKVMGICFPICVVAGNKCHGDSRLNIGSQLPPRGHHHQDTNTAIFIGSSPPLELLPTARAPVSVEGSLLRSPLISVSLSPVRPRLGLVQRRDTSGKLSTATLGVHVKRSTCVLIRISSRQGRPYHNPSTTIVTLISLLVNWIHISTTLVSFDPCSILYFHADQYPFQSLSSLPLDYFNWRTHSYPKSFLRIEVNSRATDYEKVPNHFATGT